MEQVIVKNPHTGNDVNVRPLFDFVKETGEGTMQDAAKAVDNAIRHIVTCGDFDYKNEEEMPLLKSVAIDLYRLRDAFEAMGEN